MVVEIEPVNRGWILNCDLRKQTSTISFVSFTTPVGNGRHLQERVGDLGQKRAIKMISVLFRPTIACTSERVLLPRCLSCPSSPVPTPDAGKGF
jgi:hypothetical protein